MGYTTDFTGSFKLDKPLSVAQLRYLNLFSETRRMKRNAHALANQPDEVRLAVGLPLGADGAFYVGSAADMGQAHTPDVLDYNNPPAGQPGLWCQWVPTEDGTGIEWNGTEKFYAYKEWLEYLIAHFLAPWGFVLSGEVKWAGEDSSDHGRLVVENNKVTAKKGRIVYG